MKVSKFLGVSRNKVIEILINLWYIVYRWGNPHTIKKGIPSFEELGTIP